MKANQWIMRLALAGSLFATISQSAFAYTYGCGLYSSPRQGLCVTILDPSEFGTYSQVATQATVARGTYYDFGASGWSIGISDARITYGLPGPEQWHEIAGRHCLQYYAGNSICRNSSLYSRYL